MGALSQPARSRSNMHGPKCALRNDMTSNTSRHTPSARRCFETSAEPGVPAALWASTRRGLICLHQRAATCTEGVTVAQHPATAAWQPTCYSCVFPRLGSTSFGQLPPALIANHSRPACVPRYHSRLPTRAGKFRPELPGEGICSEAWSFFPQIIHGTRGQFCSEWWCAQGSCTFVAPKQHGTLCAAHHATCYYELHRQPNHFPCTAGVVH